MGGRGRSRGRFNGKLLPLTALTQKQTSGAPATQTGIKQSQAEIDKLKQQLADQQKADKAAAMERERVNQANAESMRAKMFADANRGMIDEQLASTLAQPIVATAQQYAAMNPFTVGAYGKNQQQPAPAQQFSPTPLTQTTQAVMAQKLNAGGGGTNQQQNQFQAPNTSGLTFGGV
jgi:hypothetical protein